MAENDTNLIFVTGATGYIGGRLVPWLLQAGYRVRCLTRSEKKLRARDWVQHPDVEIVEGNADDGAGLAKAMVGCRAAYYMIHSMTAAGPEYRQRDRELAETFAKAAATAGVEHILYLGGLGETGAGLSEHLTSRREVEKALRITEVPVTVLRAAMIIGSGSASFEILRYLVERLPVMVTPRWVRTECQPIAVRNVLEYLVRALDCQAVRGQTLEIGGSDVLTYEEIMRIAARALGLRPRWIVPVPVLTPRLSSLWIHLVTPLSRHIARPLAEGLKNRVVVTDDRARKWMPQELWSVREAIEAAVAKVRSDEVSTSWTDAGAIPGDPDWSGGKVFEDVHRTEIAATQELVLAKVCEIGGSKGYYRGSWLWTLRGWLDRCVGGPGLRRGRRHPRHLAVGDALDFWRVAEVIPGRTLQLRAEMKLPGTAVLEFQTDSLPTSPRTQLTLTATFRPRGLFGLLYWYAVVPFHGYVFRGMLDGIQAECENADHGGMKAPVKRFPSAKQSLPDEPPSTMAVGTYERV